MLGKQCSSPAGDRIISRRDEEVVVGRWGLARLVALSDVVRTSASNLGTLAHVDQDFIKLRARKKEEIEVRGCVYKT